mmetsp:Transcript_106902/g.279158  ORF Transcript_106902/g.279158 Transcript_106902/m.279158 type:complete len:265 (-) Transcript_106902:91-885(-)
MTQSSATPTTAAQRWFRACACTAMTAKPHSTAPTTMTCFTDRKVVLHKQHARLRLGRSPPPGLGPQPHPRQQPSWNQEQPKQPRSFVVACGGIPSFLKLSTFLFSLIEDTMPAMKFSSCLSRRSCTRAQRSGHVSVRASSHSPATMVGRWTGSLLHSSKTFSQQPTNLRSSFVTASGSPETTAGLLAMAWRNFWKSRRLPSRFCSARREEDSTIRSKRLSMSPKKPSNDSFSWALCAAALRDCSRRWADETLIMAMNQTTQGTA